MVLGLLLGHWWAELCPRVLVLVCQPAGWWGLGSDHSGADASSCIGEAGPKVSTGSLVDRATVHGVLGFVPAY